MCVCVSLCVAVLSLPSFKLDSYSNPQLLKGSLKNEKVTDVSISAFCVQRMWKSCERFTLYLSVIKVEKHLSLTN